MQKAAHRGGLLYAGAGEQALVFAEEPPKCHVGSFGAGDAQGARDIAHGGDAAVAAVADRVAIDFEHHGIAAVADGHAIAIDFADSAVAAVADGDTIAIDFADRGVAGVAQGAAVAVHFALGKADKCGQHQCDCKNNFFHVYEFC